MVRLILNRFKNESFFRLIFKDAIFIIFLILFFTKYTYASSITFNFQGNILSKTCTPPADISNYLGRFNSADLAKVNAHTIYSSISFKLTDCSSSTNFVTATFTGNPDGTSDRTYVNDPGGAKNIEIQLISEKEGLPLGNNKSLKVNVNQDTHEAFFQLKYRLVSKEGNAKPGKVSTTVTANFTYN